MIQKPDYRELHKSYLAGIFSGIWVTGTHFLANLACHIAGLFYAPARRRASVTIQYPEQERRLSPRLRTLHRLTKRADGSPRCVACMMCETICPALCIYIVAEEVADLDIEKRPQSFTIDLGRCVFCGLCVEACPEDAIRMDTTILEFSALNREGMVYNLEQLLALEPRQRGAAE